MSEKSFKILFFTAIIIIVALAFIHNLFPKEYEPFLFFGTSALFAFTFIMMWQFSMREIKLKDGRSFDQFVKDEGFEDCNQKSIRNDYLEKLKKISEYEISEILWTTKNKRRDNWYCMEIIYSQYRNKLGQDCAMMFPVSIQSNFSISRSIGSSIFYRISKLMTKKPTQVERGEVSGKYGSYIIQGTVDKEVTDSIIREIESVFKNSGSAYCIANTSLSFSVTVEGGVCFVKFSPQNGPVENFELIYKISEILS